MKWQLALGSAVVLSFCTSAYVFGDAPASPDFSGTWQSESDGAVKWVLKQDDGKIHIQELRGSGVEADYSCPLGGTECNIEDSGHSEKTCLYFNGPKLVELRTRGEDVVKRRFTLSDGGKTMELELLPISPPGKTEKLAFQKVDTAH